MKSKFNPAGWVALAALALSFSAISARAQEFRGKFTLPVEATWGGAVLPAGDYDLSVQTTTSGLHLITVRGEGKAALIPSFEGETKAPSNDSKLVLVNVGGIYAVRIFEAGDAGLTFDYPLPKAKARQTARASGSMQTVSVSGDGQ